MTGAWHGGKGSDPRPEAEQGAFARGFDKIDWNARERAREIQSRLCRCHTTDQRRYCADRDNCLRAEAL